MKNFIQKLGWAWRYFLILFNKRIQLRGFVKIDRNVQWIVEPGSKIIIGKNVEIRRFTVIAAQGEGVLEIEDHVFIAHGVTIMAGKQVRIGQHTMIAEYVSIRDTDHNYQNHPEKPLNERGSVSLPTLIEDNVWVGAKSTINKGIRIQSDAIIGANSVVTKDVPARTVVVGAPAKPIKEY
ncbi:MAG: acyltransferase [Candidatus Margulisbacteria bacterium]|nr:acyltransferase [Candidatus Margulisiibacteriota bacterium]